MAQYTNLTLTEKGLALQTKAQTGIQLKITKVAIGDGTLDTGNSLVELTGLKRERMSVAIANLSIENGSAIIKANFSNKDLMESFYLRELGVFANDPDEGEILYAVAKAGDQGDYLPADNGNEVIEQVFTLSLVVGSATDVTATFAESIYVLKTGDTMTGPLKLSGDPTANLHAVTKQYVDNSFWDYYGTADPTTVSGVTVKPMFRWADVTNKVIKIRNFLNTAWIPFMDMETGNILTNAATSSNATNVTTNINGHAITDIIEADGVTVKNTTKVNNKTADDTANNIALYDSGRKVYDSNRWQGWNRKHRFEGPITINNGGTYQIELGGAVQYVYAYNVRVNSEDKVPVVLGYSPTETCAYIKKGSSGFFNNSPDVLFITNRSGATQSFSAEIVTLNSN